MKPLGSRVSRSYHPRALVESEHVRPSPDELRGEWLVLGTPAHVVAHGSIVALIGGSSHRLRARWLAGPSAGVSRAGGPARVRPRIGQRGQVEGSSGMALVRTTFE